ncbi:Protein of unknown function [Singulisphaera sp. GP187]|uniref:DUF1549 and DUF1553 domain-containing protein n=1 Tax=Singulisphaera sp. GP187 TaxID=1882752 RepID=UPI00092C02C5|nr:DUF1549 and DUF1553 domain-containing protein [Singulisphaera sp. GP187]SIO15558.1 Protein of unknown function [Singulisphaera sp. GP187]
MRSSRTGRARPVPIAKRPEARHIAGMSIAGRNAISCLVLEWLLLHALALPACPASLVVEPAEIQLLGSDRRAQILVSKTSGSDRPMSDLTHDGSLHFKSLNPAVAVVDRQGRVRPTGAGEARITIDHEGDSASVRVVVDDFADRRPVSFTAEVMPILARQGCNSGACHGKASGQNGFRLSLLGSDPRFDYESLVRDSRGRRVFPAAPAASLLLRKPTAELGHGGGRKFARDSPEYRTLARWIAQGMPYDPTQGPSVLKIEVTPARRRIEPKRTQQLRVTAQLSDGSEADVTHLAQYQSNALDLAAVDESGRVAVLDGVGEAAIMARFGGQVAVARLIVPRLDHPTPWDAPPSTNPIDPLIFGKLRELGIPPSATCTDAEFARRSALDLCGILPDPGEVAAFEASHDPSKRAQWVDRLLDRPEYSDLFAMKWSAILRNKRSLGALSQPGTFAFHAWIREALAENLPYDQFAAAILTAKGDSAASPPVVWFRHAKTLEEQVDDTAQLFLGVRLQCARCHHHPFESWGQDDYYGFAAHFARVGRKPGPDPVTPRIFVLPEGQATDPLTGKTYAPRVLGGSEQPNLGPHHDPREELANWLRRPDNPFLARAIVNRYWKHLFGRGLFEPEDDMRASNPPSNPELLDFLAADFVRHGHDLKQLLRLMATSRAYDRSSLPTPGNERDRQNYARYAPRRLPAEVLLDAIGTVTGSPDPFEGLPRNFRATQLPDDGYASALLETFGRPKRESVCECERVTDPSLSQSLLLLNSPTLQRQLSADEGRAALLANDPRPDRAKIASLYRVALSRPPSDAEQAVCLAHINRLRPEGRVRQAYEDLIWTLINTKEFLFNQ